MNVRLIISNIPSEVNEYPLCYNPIHNIPTMTSVPIHLFNTLTKQKETFKPNIEGHVSMYHCGPTVYNDVQIGNLRAYVAADTLRRVFQFNDYTVSQVMNITDIGHLQHDEIDEGDDKMTLALRREGKELTRENMKEIGLRYFNSFLADCQKMNILHANLYALASDYIDEDISFVQKLLDKGNAYIADDGVYFDTMSLADAGGAYGRLGGLAQDDEKAESRIGEDEIAKSKKKSIRDFALWKFNDELGYDAPFGKGFPGWHIECSVMSMKYLGGLDEFAGEAIRKGREGSGPKGITSASHTDIEWQNFKTFDIHTGGIDHIPVHHNNEIAQTEAISGKQLAHFWLHNAHVIMEGGRKMAKSGEGFVTLPVAGAKGISPLGLRYWVLGASYRTSLQFSWDALENAERSYRNLVDKVAYIRHQAGMERHGPDAFSDLDEYIEERSEILDDATASHIEKFKTLVNDDLNTPKALAMVYEDIIGNSEVSFLHKMHLIKRFDEVLGLDLMAASKELAERLAANAIVPSDITELAEKRKAAREAKDWATSDSIREQLDKLGYEIKDDAGVENGYIVTKKLI